MRSTFLIPNKIFTEENLIKQVFAWKMLGKRIIFTNGVFDVLHKGHIASLSEAAGHGEILIVAVNADTSVKKLKGDSRPINDEQARALVLASLVQTDAVIIFKEATPLELIKKLMPDVLVKGGDYTIEQIAGAKEVIAAGGEVKLAAMVKGISSTQIIDKISVKW
ncbi:MAG: D-glycero-beta-D-manno-heptose 1-phosphate adenylyltransferase [Ferruginibacter sp.]|nr:D-glycero-beta-D-manno-heptose 1-phosphate adenylyltransferase [Ferruginibacter sp.]